MNFYRFCSLIKSEKFREEKALDEALEASRLKGLQEFKEKEAAHLTEQRKGAAVIVDQIRERFLKKLREEEIQDQERDMVLREIAAQKEQEVLSLKATSFYVLFL